MTRQPVHLVIGPSRHGVVSFGVALAESLARRGYPAPVVRVEDWTGIGDALERLDAARGVHVNVTDRLFGPTPAAAADRIVDLVRHVTAGGGRVTATLHDVPQRADGGNYAQRVLAYRTVCAALHGAATNSEHERSLLAENALADPADVVVVPLPLELDGATVRPRDGGRRSVAVLGFLYPGKGHAEVIAAMSALPPDVEFHAIGECSAGHEDMADDLARSARATGRRLAITGYVPSHALDDVLQRVSVPVAHHRHVSASGSLNTWIGAHRRPLAPANRYTVEHDGRHPGTVRLYPDTHHGLAEAIESALEDPDSTWLAAGSASGATQADAARLYAEALTRWHD